MSESKSALTLRAFVYDHNVNEIETTTNNQQSNVVELDSSLPPIEAAKILWEKNIVGAPVWDDSAKKYVGFFEMRDILSSVIANAKAEKEEEETNSVDRYNERMVKELNITDKNGKKLFADVKPSDLTISYLAARNQFVFCNDDAKLNEVCECLMKKHCHRVPILDRDGKCKNIISQSQLIKFISRNCNHDSLQDTIREAGIPYMKDVVSVLDTVDASEAFTLLDNKRLSGIAVIDDDGKLVGNTSARDIKLAAVDEGRTAMDTDILSYLAKVRQAVPQKKERYPSCHVHEDATVAHVIDLLAKTGYHRVFVVDENVHPIGVISVTDITTFALDGEVKNSSSFCCV
mmetsp:Transcript_2697/g.3900  ORF Transcript_2697/g.3900 Transcript_2697/m.3900 type:complete len:346 (-) Transcript_2697:2463-3500(-)|eukprot:CAMPEP_0203697202 /NCGR_PEP_ID=MMETSP0091-20130426/8242_1 /ASSEMBLY_ACC=CAM_ASM_001089 /TAXON_ID=426623 /ORGANISM="Chaetoceros affinis, Strain CCMP159" /LENGTH=345 /DNA_ID=CAMNT_0050569157 /DNA_START=20 /DNA_END=1057 /DNA_ORIENTATION=-